MVKKLYWGHLSNPPPTSTPPPPPQPPTTGFLCSSSPGTHRSDSFTSPNLYRSRKRPGWPPHQLNFKQGEWRQESATERKWLKAAWLQIFPYSIWTFFHCKKNKTKQKNNLTRYLHRLLFFCILSSQFCFCFCSFFIWAASSAKVEKSTAPISKKLYKMSMGTKRPYFSPQAEAKSSSKWERWWITVNSLHVLLLPDTWWQIRWKRCCATRYV